MRIVFMGSPDFAVPSLNALVEAGQEVIAAYCQPPRPAGRGKAERRTAVHERAEQLGIQVRTPKTLRNEEEQMRFRELGADLAVVAAYGLILPKPILEAPKRGCINVHASLLPRWRGAAPIQRAILAGDEATGVTLMQMDEGLDTGPMLFQMPTKIHLKTAGELTEELAKLGALAASRGIDVADHAFVPGAHREIRLGDRGGGREQNEGEQCRRSYRSGFHDTPFCYCVGAPSWIHWRITLTCAVVR